MNVVATILRILGFVALLGFLVVEILVIYRQEKKQEELFADWYETTYKSLKKEKSEREKKMNRLEELKERIYEAEPRETFYVYIPVYRISFVHHESGLKWVKAKVYHLLDGYDIRLFACEDGDCRLYELTENNFKTVEEMEEENE